MIGACVECVCLPFVSSSIDLGSTGDLSGDHNRIARSLLAVNPTADPNVLPGHFINSSNCLFVFNNGIDAVVNTFTYNAVTKKLVAGEVVKFNLTSIPSSYSTSCANYNSTNPNATLNMVYRSDKISGDKVTGVTLTLELRISKAGKYWMGSGLSHVAIQSSASNLNKDLKLRDADITATNGFSFSCSNLRLRTAPANNETLTSIILNIKRFQLQPFSTQNPNRIFADSFDCSTWFTISLWVGLFVTLLFGAIISLGIFMLFEIKTMDRFENPKGKTITVATGD